MGDPAQRVQVVDLDMPFFSMVWFICKWAVAAIPAAILLGVLGVLFWGVLAGFARSL